MLNKIIKYFDLQSNNRSIIASGHASAKHAYVFPQYIAIVCGIILEPYLRKYISDGSWNIDYYSILGRTVFALIMAVLILPGLYKSSFDETKPIIIQVFTLIPMGMGWQSIFASATKLAGV